MEWRKLLPSVQCKRWWVWILCFGMDSIDLVYKSWDSFSAVSSRVGVGASLSRRRMLDNNRHSFFWFSALLAMHVVQYKFSCRNKACIDFTCAIYAPRSASLHDRRNVLDMMHTAWKQVPHPCLTPPLRGNPSEFLDETYDCMDCQVLWLQGCIPAVTITMFLLPPWEPKIQLWQNFLQQ